MPAVSWVVCSGWSWWFLTPGSYILGHGLLRWRRVVGVILVCIISPLSPCWHFLSPPPRVAFPLLLPVASPSLSLVHSPSILVIVVVLILVVDSRGFFSSSSSLVLVLGRPGQGRGGCVRIGWKPTNCVGRGVRNLEGGEQERRKRTTMKVVVRFRDVLRGPPTSWVPPCGSPFPNRPSNVNQPPTSLWKGEGRLWQRSILRILGCW